MRQNAVLIKKAQEFREPVLLVGETGGGKTTICKILADFNGQELVTVNCHMHTESSDFLGGLHPVRDHTVSCYLILLRENKQENNISRQANLFFYVYFSCYVLTEQNNH